jgi:hypothetical protein
MTMLADPRVQRNEAAIVRRFTSSLPVRVGELAKELGLKVTRTPLSPRFSGLIKPSNETPSNFEIKVNKYESAERQRFTVAHEIAHFLLHRNEIGAGLVDSVMYRSTLTSHKETEANRLAADIVMPAHAVTQELRKRGGKATDDVVNELAEVFRVSVPAMRVRLGIA